MSRNKVRCQGIYHRHHWQRGICSRCGVPRNPLAKALAGAKPAPPREEGAGGGETVGFAPASCGLNEVGSP